MEEQILVCFFLHCVSFNKNKIQYIACKIFEILPYPSYMNAPIWTDNKVTYWKYTPEFLQSAKYN